MSAPESERNEAGPSTPSTHRAGPSCTSSTITGENRDKVDSVEKGQTKVGPKSRDGAQPRAGSTSTSTSKSKSKSKPRPKPIPQPIEAFEDPGAGEEETVHEVYERIAPHFSQTRYKPWPLITKFLTSLPPNSIGLDSGAGNGKYIPAAFDAGHSMIALDRSLGLLDIAKTQRGGGDVIRGDLGARCWRAGVYDFVISVAAIHHLSTPERRRQAVQALLPCLRLASKGPYSRFFIYVWAYEQGSASKRAMGSAAAVPSQDSVPAPGQDCSDGRTPAPSSLSTPQPNSASTPVPGSITPSTLETTASIPTKAAAPAPAPRIASEIDTHPIQKGLEEMKIQDVLVPWVLKAKAGEEDIIHHRYYHLFIKGELREMVLEAAKAEGYLTPDEGEGGNGGSAGEEDYGGSGDGAWLRVRGEGWEADNWWIEAEVGKGPYRPERPQSADSTTVSAPDRSSELRHSHSLG